MEWGEGVVLSTIPTVHYFKPDKWSFHFKTYQNRNVLFLMCCKIRGGEMFTNWKEHLNLPKLFAIILNRVDA